MSKQQKSVFLSVFIILFILCPFADGGMKIELRSGAIVDVPVDKDDIISIRFEDKPGSALGETLIVPNDKPIKIMSKTVLERGRWYAIEASGVISDWSHVKDGIDAVWCYGEWRCGKQGEVWDQLRIDGKGMTEIAGKAIPYNSQHKYRIRYQGQGKPVELYCIDAIGSSSDNSGSFTVTITPE